MKLLLINPNTSVATTELMRSIAAETAGVQAEVEACTATRGASKIVDAKMLEAAADAVCDVVTGKDLTPFDGVIISGLGDPGLERLRRRTAVPVTGIAEAAFSEACAGGRRYSVIVTTPGLVSAIAARVADYGHDRHLAGIRLVQPAEDGADASRSALHHALHTACEAAVRDDGAEAIVIGGGPLAAAARALRGQLGVTIVEPVPAAVRLAIARARSSVQ